MQVFMSYESMTYYCSPYKYCYLLKGFWCKWKYLARSDSTVCTYTLPLENFKIKMFQIRSLPPLQNNNNSNKKNVFDS